MLLAGALLAGCADPDTSPETPAEVVRAFMADEAIPGGVLAFGRVGQRPHVMAFGFADVAQGRPMQPDTRLPLASLSKPLTASLVLTLFERQGLGLETRLVQVFPDVAGAADPRYQDITTRDLLAHSGGWDRRLDFEPILEFALAEDRLGLASPDSCEPIADAMLSRPLQFAPGARYAYSNLGYCWLQRMVAGLAGQDYDSFAMGLLDVWVPGNRLHLGLPVDEPTGLQASLYVPSPTGERRPLVVAQWQYRILGAAGGWTGPVLDVWQLLARPIPPETRLRPAYAAAGEDYYGLGWRVWPGEAGDALSHYGAMPGAFSVAVRSADGQLIVALFNARPRDDWAAFLRLKRGWEQALDAAGRD